MSFLRFLTIGLSVIWCATEVFVTVRKRASSSSRGKDRLSYLFLWIAIMVSITFAILTQVRQMAAVNTARISFLLPFVGYFGCLLMTLGQMIRIVAIFTLRRQFTVHVSIIKDHKIVDTGIYRIVRHPAYLGSLLTFLGAGLALENWLTLIILFFLPLAATAYRIGVEERALLDHFGAAYQAYARRTRRLIPGIY